MKRALCVILAVLCLFACASCKRNDNPFFGDLSGDTAATHIKTVVTYTYTEASKNTTVFNGEYSTKINGEDSITEFSYERFATVGDTVNVEGNVKTISGTIYRKDGQVTTKGDVLSKDDVSEAFGLKMNFDEKTLDSYEFSEDLTTMSATVSGENIAKTFGVALGVNGAVYVQMTGNGTVVESITITYTSTTGAYVQIVTTYAYDEVTLNFGA